MEKRPLAAAGSPPVQTKTKRVGRRVGTGREQEGGERGGVDDRDGVREPYRHGFLTTSPYPPFFLGKLSWKHWGGADRGMS